MIREEQEQFAYSQLRELERINLLRHTPGKQHIVLKLELPGGRAVGMSKKYNQYHHPEVPHRKEMTIAPPQFFSLRKSCSARIHDRHYIMVYH